ncbi:FAD-binding oxidoreductase [Alteromonas sp. ASW11-19]|uniref:D-lactate dehydrogenase (cytochrome) n=1 Tax=Alteromonas salexigens TaxID=2982530 RepID=A0ABT2VK82_9ALTE|nr:FAD-binding and (Fe-S)-binding domain-containing protein [Alteromonas salexigens]MCU7553223.1 FAD-binding oxidoreductase [Alteromonas salexigens]
MTDALPEPAISPTDSPSDAQWQAFSDGLTAFLSAEQIIADLPRRVALGTDASCYTQTPRLVVTVPHVAAMRALLTLAHRHGIAVTFRAAGTSLSGQAISDSVLVMLTRDWTASEILEDGNYIRLQPGIIGAHANRMLAPYQRKIGPDPASINTCKVGGIAANNASGMCCGIAHNSYHTLTHMHLLLADGSEVNTADPDSVKWFREQQAPLLDQLSALAAEVHADTVLAERIRHLYRLKNTMGYGINALLDFDDPLDMLTHLMIGSEGTLGFIADITYRTLPVPTARQSGLFLFPSARHACECIPALAALNVDAVELMDTRALHSVTDLLLPFYALPIPDGAVALLVDVSADNSAALATRLETVTQQLAGEDSMTPMQPFTADPVVIEQLWQIRKGLFPAVGANRPGGTTVIIEDVAFPLGQLADGLDSLRASFVKHGYADAIIFGHALDGNVHFVFSQRFDTPEAIARYDNFMRDIVRLVTVQFDGTLKAEHGTGRNMAPFLRDQWGDAGVAVMQQIKSLIDPAGILNPGVIINPHGDAHLAHLKSLPTVDAEVDKCIECGFCEPQCPSRHYTLTPRQRIALRRRQQDVTLPERTEIDTAFAHLGIDSCAATGMCATTCPVGIDTGKWVTTLRARNASHPLLAKAALASWPALSAVLRGGLTVSHALGKRFGEARFTKISKHLHTTSGKRFPVWYPSLPAGAKTAVPRTPPLQDKMVYVPACPNRVFGAPANRPALQEVIARLCQKADIEIITPANANTLCCGQSMLSKGYPHHAHTQQRSWQQAIAHTSEHGRWPVVTDASPCAALSSAGDNPISTIELSEYLLSHVVPRLSITPLEEPVLLHVTCASTKLDNGQALRTLARVCSRQVVEADDIACCGFAGDKGLFEPGLNASALASLKRYVPVQCTWGISNSRGCEIGLSEHSGVTFQHVAYLLDAVSQPLSQVTKP